MTMKMISNTSSTSIRGVTFGVEESPLLLPVVIDIRVVLASKNAGSVHPAARALFCLNLHYQSMPGKFARGTRFHP
jgi:hypothetical protein